MMNDNSKLKPGPVCSKRQQDAEAILTKLVNNIDPGDLRQFLLHLNRFAAHGVLEDPESKHKKIMITSRFLDFLTEVILWQEEQKFADFLVDAAEKWSKRS